MSAPLTIALDAMGGDKAPGIVIKGANIARKRFPRARFLIYGDENKISPLLRKLPLLRESSAVVHTDEVVTSDAKPSQALRQGRNSSMQLAINAVRDGDASGVVSAGNTGALMAMSKICLKTLPGIDRPAIAAFYPTLRGESVMLDLGANVDCDADNLFQFSVMGVVFARTVLGLLKPSVGLLNVGSEEGKGKEALNEAASALRDIDLPMIFHGFVEGNDISAGTVDVVVSDGFSGNIAIKSIEGAAKVYGEFLRETFKSSITAGIGYMLARRALKKLRMRLDPRRYNGAMFLGLNGVVVKSHGGADAFGFANAIGVAVDMAMNGFNDKITKELAILGTGGRVAARAAAS